MPRQLPEEQQGLPDHDFQLAADDAKMVETRIRRKMVINPKQRAASPAAITKTTRIPSVTRLSSPVNLIFAVLSSATFGWVVHNWHGR